MQVLAMAMGAAAAAVRYVRRKKKDLNQKKNNKKHMDLDNGEWLPRHHPDATDGGRSFSLAEIMAATLNFSETRVLGIGEQGKVFGGVVVDVDGKDAEVVIKRATPLPGQSAREFRTQADALFRLRHRHLVPLVGSCSCSKEGETILVRRYMPRGTLREHLTSGAEAKPVMPWWRRLDACMGAARGLHCLHAGGVIHGAVKASSVLIDENWVAKLSDYGLSNGPTMESDVHSFGVLLFEVLMARQGDMDSGLADYALACHRNGTLQDAVDQAIKDQVAPECLEKFAETAVECLAGKGTERPAMGDVLWNLELVVQLQLLNSKST